MGERRRKEAHYRSLWPVGQKLARCPPGEPHGGRNDLLEPLSVTAQTTRRNYPGSCSQREPKRPKGDVVRSDDFRGFVCGALVLVVI
jgi:hypothetical protein